MATKPTQTTEAAPETPAAPAVPPPVTSEQRIAELEAKIALLVELASKPNTPTVTSEAVMSVVQPGFGNEILPGSMQRPEVGPLHFSAGTPLFNPHRPTGRHG